MKVKTERGIRRVPRYLHFADLHETFIVSAVLTILFIRTELWLTNYPQLGGGGLHIAHVLWGGLFMMLAIGLLLTYLGRFPLMPAAVVGGVGFGFFIDELGKFITSDNDYFYRPTAALVYLIFLALFFVTRAMRRRRPLSSLEYVANAMELLTEAVRHDFDERERKQAIELLEKADKEEPLVSAVRRLLGELETIPPPKPRLVTRFVRRGRDLYLGLVARPSFRATVGWVFVAWAAFSVARLGAFVLLDIEPRAGKAAEVVHMLSWVEVASIGSTALSLGLVALGLYRLTKGARVDAFRALERALLASILVTQVLAFVEWQFVASIGLGIDVALLATLRYMGSRERDLHAAASSPPTPGQSPSDEVTEALGRDTQLRPVQGPIRI